MTVTGGSRLAGGPARDVDADALAERIVRAAPTGIAAFDRRGRFLFANDVIAAFNGRPLDEVVGHLLSDVRPQAAERATRVIATVLETGEPVIDLETVASVAGDPIERRWFTSYFPLPDDAGTVSAVGVFVVEATKREQRLSFLAEATESLASSLETDVTLGRVAELAAGALGAFAAVHVVDRQGLLRRAASAHIDPEQAALVDTIADIPPRPGGALWTAFESNEVRLFEEVTEEVLLEEIGDDPERLAIARHLAMGPSVVVPLTAREETFGTLTVSKHRGETWQPADLEFAAGLARRAALAVDNARLFAQRSEIARALQQALLPPDLPDVPGVELAARFSAGGAGVDVGGDFYDVFPAGEGAWALLVGDVCGSGPEAAALTSQVRHRARGAARTDPSPSTVVSVIDEALLARREDEHFCTLVYGVLSRADASIRVELVNGGHPAPLVVRAGGAVDDVVCTGGLVGSFPGLEREPCAIELLPGDALVLFTDGVTEARRPGSPEQFGLDALRRLLATHAAGSADAIASAVEEAVRAHSGGALADDAAVLVARAL